MRVGSRVESIPSNAWTESGRTPVLPESSNSRLPAQIRSTHMPMSVRRMRGSAAVPHRAPVRYPGAGRV